MSLILNGTDGLSDVDGTAGTPAIRGTDANTGIFFPAADTIAFSEGGTEAMRIDSSGNVGIGNTSPVDRLQIEKASANCLLSVSRTTGGAGGRLVMQHTDSVGALQTTASVPLTFGTNDTERMRIDSAGRVLIGTTSTTNFDEGIRTNSTGSGNSMQVIISNTGGGLPFLINRSDDGNIIDFRRAGTNVGAISVTTTNTAYNTSSDYRLKENIAPMTGALAKITQLKPVTYTWKSTGKTSQGFIAHELQAVVPDCVTGEKDAVDEEGNPVHQGVDTSYLVATLTAAIQELKAELDSIKAELATLKAQP